MPSTKQFYCQNQLNKNLMPDDVESLQALVEALRHRHDVLLDDFRILRAQLSLKEKCLSILTKYISKYWGVKEVILNNSGNVLLVRKDGHDLRNIAILPDGSYVIEQGDKVRGVW